jgi:hypothetical protein
MLSTFEFHSWLPAIWLISFVLTPTLTVRIIPHFPETYFHIVWLIIVTICPILNTLTLIGLLGHLVFSKIWELLNRKLPWII